MSNHSVLLFGDIFICREEFRKYYSHMNGNFITLMCKDAGVENYVFIRSLFWSQQFFYFNTIGSNSSH